MLCIYYIRYNDNAIYNIRQNQVADVVLVLNFFEIISLLSD